MAGIDALFASEAVKNDKLVIQALSNLGDMCIAEARDRAEEDSWFNQTGNLRSSIGYIVVPVIVTIPAEPVKFFPPGFMINFCQIS